MLFLQGLVLRGKLGFVGSKLKHDHRYEHYCRDYYEQRLIVYVSKSLRLGLRVHYGSNSQVDYSAQGAHKVDYGVGLGAKRLGRYVRHQSNGRRSVGAHRYEQKPQQYNEHHDFPAGGRRRVAVVQDGQYVHKDYGAGGTEDYVGHALAYLCVGAVGQRSEQRKQEQSENVVRAHNDAGDGLVHVEGLGEDEGHNVVVHLPERADGQECQSYEYGPFVVELHCRLL